MGRKITTKLIATYTKLSYKKLSRAAEKSHDINLIKANRIVFITWALITTHPQLNIVSSGISTIVLVKPWETRSSTTRCFKRDTILTIPEWIRCVEDTTPTGIAITGFTVVMITNERWDRLSTAINTRTYV